MTTRLDVDIRERADEWARLEAALHASRAVQLLQPAAASIQDAIAARHDGTSVELRAALRHVALAVAALQRIRARADDEFVDERAT